MKEGESDLRKVNLLQMQQCEGRVGDVLRRGIGVFELCPLDVFLSLSQVTFLLRE